MSIVGKSHPKVHGEVGVGYCCCQFLFSSHLSFESSSSSSSLSSSSCISYQNLLPIEPRAGVLCFNFQRVFLFLYVFGDSTLPPIIRSSPLELPSFTSILKNPYSFRRFRLRPLLVNSKSHGTSSCSV